MDFSFPTHVTRCIFLDVDGVLVCSRSLLLEFEEDDPTLIFDPRGSEFPLERSCVNELVGVVCQSGAGVVLTSTWRLFSSKRSFLVDALILAGIPDRNILCDTPDLRGGRGAEIRAWLKNRPVNFVILDDGHLESFALEGLSPFVVQTDMSTGLSADKAARVLDILQRMQVQLHTSTEHPTSH